MQEFASGNTTAVLQSAFPSRSHTTKQVSNSSTDQGGESGNAGRLSYPELCRSF
jgi:hypothetical protein